jgi:hypothetical protein
VKDAARPAMRAGAVRALLGTLVLAGGCSGQTARESQLTMPVVKSGNTGEGCPAGANFETAGYTVNSSRVDNPFDFLPWVHAQDEAAAQEISKLVDHQAFRYSAAITGALDIINGQDFFPNAANVKIRVRIELVVVHCADNKNLNLLYHVYSSQVTPATSGTPEGQAAQQNSPQRSAGLVDDTTPYQLTPAIGFNPTDKIYAGGALNVSLCASCKFRLQGIAEGQASQQMRSVHVAIKASRDTLGLIAHSNYLLNYNDSSLPTGAGQLRNAQASGQYSATTHSFLDGNVSARFGGLLEKGDQQAELRLPVPPGALTTTAVNALKFYGGLDSRLSNQVLSASMGLELGTTNVASGVQWKKYIGDFRHDFWCNVGDHHSIDVESRMTLGTIQAGGQIPLSERFFGGSYEQYFMPDDSWQILSDPVIRAIPGSRFFETAAGPGGDRFLSYNLTVAFAAWRRPVVPPEVNKDPQFERLLNGQITSATSVEQLHFLTLDPFYKMIVLSLPDLLNALNGLNNSVLASPQAHAEPLAAKFQSCSSAIKMATGRATHAKSSSDASQYGYVATLLKPPPVKGAAGGDPDEDRLTKVVSRCGDLVSALGPASGIALDPVVKAQDTIEMEFGQINQGAAKKKATSDMKFVSQTLHTLFHEANLISVGPVAVFDVAQIGPTGPGVTGTRYGPGGGVRLELASSVNFTVGYARNLSPGPGEGSGAIFFSMGMKDLFH